jgi:hypothetical protein
LADSKDTFPCCEKIEIKYDWKEFEMGYNFAYRNFLDSEFIFELKFREASMS